MTPLADPSIALDQDTIDALREGVAGVLSELCASTDLHAFIDGKNSLDRALWTEAGSLGWLGFGVPEAYGGLGMGVQGLALLHAELGRHAAPGPFIASLSAAQTLVETADETIRAAWLPRLAAGEISAAVPANLEVAPLTGAGAGVSGALRCLGSPDAAILLAQVGNNWAVVELAGATVTPASMWDRTREVIDVRLTDAPRTTLSADPTATRAALQRAMALAIAADCAGGARSVTERTIAYMKTREQFGQPIAGFQALKHRAADLATKLAVIDEMLAHAVLRVASGQPDADIWSGLAKAEVTETAVFITTDCVQLHGGVGFTWDFDPHIFLKRARLNEALLLANPTLRDQAADALAVLSRSGHSALELGL